MYGEGLQVERNVKRYHHDDDDVNEAPDRMSGIEANLDNISEQVARLDRVIDILTKHLAPVLRPEEPQPERDDKSAYPRPLDSPIADRLQTQAGQFAQLSRRLDILITRVDL